MYNVAMDRFCDYFETPLNKNGERYYVRQHQLRRFFAMLFFWGRSFGGIDTLCWFFGHTDAEHIYHYITEATPGSVLIAVKAQFTTERVQAHDSETQALADLLEEHFGTRQFSVLDTEELEEYIEDLLVEGIVEIEPQFFKTTDGTSYKILIHVREKVR